MTLAIRREPWYELAECRTMPPALFFPDKWNYAPPEAIAACARCNVARDCLDYALRNDERGIWAGTTELQRIVLRDRTQHHRRNSIAVRHG